jgi:DNA-binding IclR family transcriptional regulator
MAAKNHIDLVVNTMAVIEALANSEYGKPLKEIAEEVGLVKSSAFRILFTLKQAGYEWSLPAHAQDRSSLAA